MEISLTSSWEVIKGKEKKENREKESPKIAQVMDSKGKANKVC